MIGIYDDLYNVDFKLKFIFQIIVAKIIIDNGLLIDNFHGFFGVYEINSYSTIGHYIYNYQLLTQLILLMELTGF